MQEKNIGSVVQIIGPVLDIRFPAGHLPDLLNAIEIERDGGKLVCEVAQQLGDDLNPTIQNLIDGAGDLMEGFLKMDEAQRMQIIRMAAYAAQAQKHHMRVCKPLHLCGGHQKSGTGQALFTGHGNSPFAAL